MDHVGTGRGRRAALPVVTALAAALALPLAATDDPASAADATAPRVSVSAPASGATVREAPAVLTGTAGDDTAVAAVFVQVRDEASLTWLRPDGSWGPRATRLTAVLALPGARETSWSLALALPPGRYGLDAVTRDAAGNLSAKPWRTFSVGSPVPPAGDTTPPTVVVDQPLPGATVPGPTPELAGTATDDRGVSAVFVQVRDESTGQWLRPDGTWGAGARRITAAVADSTAPGAASSTWRLAPTLAPGRYGFDVVARDAAGNLSAKPWRTFTVTPAAPVQAGRVVLTPTADPATSQAVSWLAAGSETTAAVQVAADDGGDGTREVAAVPQGVTGGNPRQHFSAVLTDLEAGTTYRYRVGSPAAGWSSWATFTTAGTTPDFSFVHLGDAQVGLDSTWPRVVAAAAARAPHAVGSVHTGDLVDEAGSDTEWSHWFAGMGAWSASTNVLAAPGNHEYRGDPTLSTYKASFEYPLLSPTRASIGALAQLAEGDTPQARQHRAFFEHWERVAPETVYLTDYEGVRFVTLNPTRDMTFLTPPTLPACTGSGCPAAYPGELWLRFQAAWLDGVLAASSSPWTVVSFHQPVFSAAVGRDEPLVRQHLLPVLTRHDVDLVLMGHDHVYARGHLDADATATPGLTRGPVFLVANAGAQHYRLETDPARNVWTRHGATQVRRDQGVTTYQVVDVTQQTLHVRSYLVEKTGDAATTRLPGELLDEFTITRTDTGGSWVTEPGVSPPPAG